MSKAKFSVVFLLFLSACGNNSGSGGASKFGPNSSGGKALEGWQSATLGQEGHGGDAIVCFNIPIEQAIYKVGGGDEGGGDEDGGGSKDCGPDFCRSSPNAGSGQVWRMTDAGRQAIRSAQPLEQYLAEHTMGKKQLLERLNQMSVEDGYKKLLQPYTFLPGAFSRIAEMHRKLGWLLQDGVASEYGLMDINDSAFVNESEIDTAHCKELQAVVRRNNQLWYDKDIVSHFDNAGLVLIQLHEEIYSWAKQVDTHNQHFGRVAHQKSDNTRWLLLKTLDENLRADTLNEQLKSLGFSILYWSNQFKLPTAVGFFMTTDACVAEQKFLKGIYDSFRKRDVSYWFNTFNQRYLDADEWGDVAEPLQYNFPDLLSQMIDLARSTLRRPADFESGIDQLMPKFLKADACRGTF